MSLDGPAAVILATALALVILLERVPGSCLELLRVVKALHRWRSTRS